MNPLLAKYAIALGALVFATTLGFTCGFTVQGWKLKAAHATEINGQINKYHVLELSLEKQNSGIKLLNYQLVEAHELQEQAKANAMYFRNQLGIQTKKANDIVAITCNNMIDDLKRVTQ